MKRRQFIKSIAICAGAGAVGLPAMGKEADYRCVPKRLHRGVNELFTTTYTHETTWNGKMYIANPATVDDVFGIPAETLKFDEEMGMYYL